MEGEGGLGALVFVDTILMEAVAAAAGAGVVEREAEVIAAEEPFEGAFGLASPHGIPGEAEGLLAGADHGLGFDGLLIKVGTCAVLFVEAVAADGAEVTGLGALDGDEPAEGF